MAVLPEFRRKKIGHALAQTAIQKIREQGIDKTHIFCYQNNETGQSFWRDFGFEKREDVLFTPSATIKYERVWLT